MKKRIDRRYIFLLVFAFFFSATLFFLKTHNDKKIFATKIFDPGNIISDEIMSDYNSLTKEEIQAFLKSKNHCRNTNIKIADLYPTVKYHIKDGHFVCMAEEDFNGESGAKIIKDAATDYKINPKVLIVLLEKEQSLITDTFPHNLQYRSATGYGCPDTAPCDQKYYGFKNQVRKAAALFRSVLDGGWTNYPLGINYIQYHPNISCGGSNVNIKNRATSALYRYTPYQPNPAVLAAGYGTIPNCGAYGNRNFYLYFKNWFGNPQAEKPKNDATLSSEQNDLESIIKSKNDILTEKINKRLKNIKFPIGKEKEKKFCYTNKKKENYCVQRYENGYIISGPKGAWESYGDIRKRWSELGYENGVLGYPIDEVYNYSKNDQKYSVQRYENGYIISGPKGAWESYGDIRKRWSELGYENGVLGYPIGPIIKSGNEVIQKYENGYISL